MSERHGDVVGSQFLADCPDNRPNNVLLVSGQFLPGLDPLGDVVERHTRLFVDHRVERLGDERP